MKTLSKIIKNNKLYLLLLLIIFIVAFFIRFYNLKSYHTLWADDGGGHIIYTEKILNEHRPPNLDETYLAWHEPLYYIILSVWINFGDIFGLEGIDWWEALNIFIYFIFLVLVWLFSYLYSKENKWLALLNVFIFSILFVGVKLSAYINNELLLHTLVLLLLILFLRFDLLSKNKNKEVVYWAIILAIAALVKITALIILLSAFFIWFINFIITKEKHFLKYIIVVLVVVISINLPWVIYKQQNYNTYFSINIYDAKPKQNILNSDAWSYIFKINKHIFIDNPYWYSKPDSYFSVLLSDSFGDYYNLFNNYIRLENLSIDKKILTGNGRYTTPELWQSMINTNRLGILIFVIWWSAFLWWLFRLFKDRKIDNYDSFLLLVLAGGWSASIFHNLRLPYLEVGVLKAHFIYFTYPILTFLAYRQWWKIFDKKIYWFLLAFVPWVAYLLISWDLLLVNFYA